MFPLRSQSGFSLVELSIVLVILGLLTGGILAGQSLIRAAELRSVSTDLQRHHTAIMAFRDKYFALPGDMPNAVRFWGAQAGGIADGTDATCAALTTAATGTATCNGNGNGAVDFNSSSWFERFRVWQHLSNAGLIEGQYTGVVTSGGVGVENANPGQNIPRSKISNVGIYFGWWGTNTTADLWFNGDYGNSFMMGTANNSYPNGLFLRPEELWNIDTKIDDGRPAIGKLIANNANQLDCMNNVSDSNVTGVTYNLTNSSIVCSLMYRPGL